MCEGVGGFLTPRTELIPGRLIFLSLFPSFNLAIFLTRRFSLDAQVSSPSVLRLQMSRFLLSPLHHAECERSHMAFREREQWLGKRGEALNKWLSFERRRMDEAMRLG